MFPFAVIGQSTWLVMKPNHFLWHESLAIRLLLSGIALVLLPHWWEYELAVLDSSTKGERTLVV